MTNLGYLTDSFFLEEAREIIEHPDYTLVKSPNQPHFYYGNYLLLKEAPIHWEKEKLEEVFKKNFTHEKIKHFTFCWSGTHKEGLQPFLDAGYQMEELAVLTLQKEDLTKLENKNEEISIRPFQSVEDWANWIELECKEKPESFSEVGYRIFQNGRAGIYRKLNQKKEGNYYGAFMEDQLVGAAGLFNQGATGRFQSVRTQEAFRRKGICKTLMHSICQIGFQTLDSLVIVAEKDYHALGLYQGLGFKQTDSQTSVFWAPH